jgi:hypothetical protein
MFSDSKRPEKLLDELAMSIRKEIERTEPTRLKERTEEIISLLSGNRELADRLVSGKLTADAIVAMPCTKSSGMAEGIDGLGSLGDDPNPHVPIDRRHEIAQKVTISVQETLCSKVSGFAAPRHSIAIASADLVKALAEASKDRKAFEAAVDAALIEVTNYHTCSKLVSGIITPRDFAKGLVAQSTRPVSRTIDVPSESPKVGNIATSIQIQSDRSSDDHSTSSFLSSTFQRLFGSSTKQH